MVADVVWFTCFNCSHVYVGYFSGMPADYVFMLVFNAICIDVSLQQLKYGKMVQLKVADISTSVVTRGGSVKQRRLLFSSNLWRVHSFAPYLTFAIPSP